MSGEQASVRRLLPQSSQMQSFSFVPTNFAPRETQKNYVFVDEHNRHKRLKVMRACEGCRRRKIKCDAATTNTWPCSACIRLKLQCIPPTMNYDGSGATQGIDQDRQQYDNESGDDDFGVQIPLQAHLAAAHKAVQSSYNQVPYTDPTANYQSLSYAAQPTTHNTLQYSNMNGGSVLDSTFAPQATFQMPPVQPAPQSLPSQPTVQTPDQYQQDNYTVRDLADYLGDLKMDVTATAPYLNNKKKVTALEEPVFEEPDNFAQALPTLTTGPDHKIRIPPELMPDEETALQYLDIFFTNVHPYVPVLNKAQFYQQWQTSRDSISPLILEAIFAIAGKLADEPTQGQQWLALASRHADSFMDIPRLSTLQAMLLVLKARENLPKRGYYYRSWMTVVQLIAMARDLGLDEHYEEHKNGRPCGHTPLDCVIRTRVWQTMFVVELLVGSPQGRTDLSIDPSSVDLSIPRPEDPEYHVARQFTYFAQCVANTRKMSDVYSRAKKKAKDWALDTEFIQLDSHYEAWHAGLPHDMQISFPPDTSPPWLPSHMLGNIHTHYHLGKIIMHRPQLALMEPGGLDGKWKHHMLICYNHAKLLCRTQEGLLNSFGAVGMLSMQRGINYTIYCILTCTVLHLVALTSPDPELNKDAREYFTRHMQLLEKCTALWPMPDMQHQIDALREAFSADTGKPFKLKPSFPYGSPPPSQQSPSRGMQYQQQPQLTRNTSIDGSQPQGLMSSLQQQNNNLGYIGHPISPSSSVGMDTSKGDSPAVQSLVMMATGQRVGQRQQLTSSSPVVDPSSWNPSRIFDQWHTTFGPPATNIGQQQQSAMRHGSYSGTDVSSVSDAQNQGMLPLPLASQTIPSQQYSTLPGPSFVSPSMWQESVASVYEGGFKRHWDDDQSVNYLNQAMKRR